MTAPPTADDDARPTNVRWLIFTLAAATSWMLYLHRYTWNFIRPELKEDYGFSNVQLEGIYTVFNLSYGAAQIPSGILCDVLGVHLVLVAIVLLWSAVLPTVGLTGNVYGLYGLRVVFGLAQAGCYPALTRVTKSWFPQSTRTVVQGFIASFFGRSGGAMATLVMGTLLMGHLGLSWRMALGLMAGAGVLLALALALFYRDDPAKDPRVNAAELALIRKGEKQTEVAGGVLPWSRVMRNRSMKVFIFEHMLNAGADTIYVSTIGSYFLEAHRIDISEAGLLVSLPLFGGALGGVVGGVVNDALIHWTGTRRWSRSIVGFVGKVMAAALMFYALAQDTPLGVAWGLFAIKFFGDSTQPTVWGTCTDMGGRYAATTFGIINTAANVGGLITPLVIGLLLDAYSQTQVVDGEEVLVTNFLPMFVLVSAMNVVAGIAWLFIDCTESLDDEDEVDSESSAEDS